MPTPLYLQLAKDQRLAYLTREAALTGDLAKLYAGAEQSVEARIKLLEQQLLLPGMADTTQQKFILARLKLILAQIRAELRNPADRAAKLVTANQLTAAQMATDGALAMTRAVGITSPFATLPADALHHLAGHMQDGTPLSDVFSRYGDEAAESMKQVLFTGVAQGVGAAKIASGLVQAVRGLTRYKALQIGRTESMRAQRAAAIGTYRINQDICDGWQWTCEPLESSCLACLEMDGTFHTNDEVFGSHPNCFLPGTIVSGPKVLASTTHWYSGEIVDIQFSNGHKFSVTKNHPILTPKGWVAAGLLQEGDDVISDDLGQGIIPVVRPDDYQVPARIEDVARSVGESSEGGTVRMVPISSEDLHGDAVDGDVCIVRANGLLHETMLTPETQPGFQQQFIRAISSAPLFTSLRSLTSLFHRTCSTATRIMSSRRIGEMLFRSTFAHHQLIGCGSSTDGHVIFYEEFTKRRAGDIQGLSDLVFGFARHITANHRDINSDRFLNMFMDRDVVTDESLADNFSRDINAGSDAIEAFPVGISLQDTRIVKVVTSSPRYYSGYVYNLQTVNGWYSANSIIVHNCRCHPTMHFRHHVLVGRKPARDWFEDQEPEVKVKMMGPSLYSLYAGGHVTLSDLVDRHESQWGPTCGVKSVVQLYREGRITADHMDEAYDYAKFQQ